MDALLLMVVCFAGYLIAYHTYGRFLARKIFKVCPDARVPSRELEDGINFVPIRLLLRKRSAAREAPATDPKKGIRTKRNKQT